MDRRNGRKLNFKNQIIKYKIVIKVKSENN